MQPLQESFDDKLCAQIQPLDLVDDFGLEILFDSGLGLAATREFGMCNRTSF